MSILSFQFHYGTIKRNQQMPKNYMLDYFNSTMVRLKVDTAISDGEVNANFNSTMVRLKGSLNVVRIAFLSFQFHYGTIKRIRASHRPYLLWLFQFHYGTIKRIVRRYSPLCGEISIPLWYD